MLGFLCALSEIGTRGLPQVSSLPTPRTRAICDN